MAAKDSEQDTIARVFAELQSPVQDLTLASLFIHNLLQGESIPECAKRLACNPDLLENFWQECKIKVGDPEYRRLIKQVVQLAAKDSEQDTIARVFAELQSPVQDLTLASLFIHNLLQGESIPECAKRLACNPDLLEDFWQECKIKVGDPEYRHLMELVQGASASGDVTK